MEAVSFKLDMFEGPLDLLLHLITKHKLDIMDIEISLLLEQYLEYIEELDHEDYEYAGEFLEMAARLIYIKTVSLLPKPEEAEELKAELQGRILEYSVCKQLAARLRERYIAEGVFVRDELVLEEDSKAYELTHSPEELVTALLLSGKKKITPEPQVKARDFDSIVSHKIYSVTAKILFVLKRLYKTGQFEMNRLYDGMKEKSERIATFLAILELTKSGRITLSDDNSMIYFRRRTKAERELEHKGVRRTEAQRLLEQEGEYIPEELPENYDEGISEESPAEPVVNADEIPENVRYAVFEPYEQPEDKKLRPAVRRSSERIYKASEIIFLDDYKTEEPEPVKAEPAEEPVPEVTVEPIQSVSPEPEKAEMVTEPDHTEQPAPLPETPAAAEDKPPQTQAEPVSADKEERSDAETSFRHNYFGVRYYYGTNPAAADKSIYSWKFIRARIN